MTENQDIQIKNVILLSDRFSTKKYNVEFDYYGIPATCVIRSSEKNKIPFVITGLKAIPNQVQHFDVLKELGIPITQIAQVKLKQEQKDDLIQKINEFISQIKEKENQ